MARQALGGRGVWRPRGRFLVGGSPRAPDQGSRPPRGVCVCWALGSLRLQDQAEGDGVAVPVWVVAGAGMGGPRHVFLAAPAAPHPAPQRQQRGTLISKPGTGAPDTPPKRCPPASPGATPHSDSPKQSTPRLPLASCRPVCQSGCRSVCGSVFKAQEASGSQLPPPALREPPTHTQLHPTSCHHQGLAPPAAPLQGRLPVCPLVGPRPEHPRAGSGPAPSLQHFPSGLCSSSLHRPPAARCPHRSQVAASQADLGQSLLSTALPLLRAPAPGAPQQAQAAPSGSRSGQGPEEAGARLRCGKERPRPGPRVVPGPEPQPSTQLQRARARVWRLSWPPTPLGLLQTQTSTQKTAGGEPGAQARGPLCLLWRGPRV